MNASLILPATSTVSRLLATTALTTILLAAPGKTAQAQVVIGDQPAPTVQDYQQKPVALPERGDWPYNVKLPRKTTAAVDPETLSSRQVSPRLMQAAHLMQSGLSPSQVQEAMTQPTPIMAAPELQGDKPDAPRDDTTTLPPVATGPLMASLADNGMGEAAAVAPAAAPTEVADNKSMLTTPASSGDYAPSSMAMLGEAPTTPVAPAPSLAAPLDAPKPAAGGGRALFGGKRVQVADATPMEKPSASETPPQVADSGDHTLKMPGEAPVPQAAPTQDVAAIPTPPADAPADTARNSTPAKIVPLTSLSAPPKLLARIGDNSRGAVQRPDDRPAETIAAAEPMPDAAPIEPVSPEPAREPQPANPPAAVLPAKADDTAQTTLVPMPQPQGGGDDTPPAPDATSAVAMPAAAPVAAAKPPEHKTFWNRIFGSSEDHPEAKPAPLPPVQPAKPLAVTAPEPEPMPAMVATAPVATTSPVVAADPEPEPTVPVQAVEPPPESTKPAAVATHKLIAPQSEPTPEPVSEPVPEPAPQPAAVSPEPAKEPQPQAAAPATPLPQADIAERPQTSVPSSEPVETPAATAPAAKPVVKAQRRTLWGDLFGYDEAKPETVAAAEPAAGAPTSDEEPYEPIPVAGFAAPAVLNEPATLSRNKPTPKTTAGATEAALPKPEDRPLEPVAEPVAKPVPEPTPAPMPAPELIPAPMPEPAPEPKAPTPVAPIVEPVPAPVAMTAPTPVAPLSDPEPPTRYIEVAEPHVVAPEPMFATQPYAAPVPIIVAPAPAPVVPAFRIEAPTTPNTDGLVTPRLVPVTPSASASPTRSPAAATISVPSGAPLAQVNFLPASQSVDSVGQAQLQAIAEAMQMGPQTRLLLNAYAKASNESESRRISLNRALMVRTKLAELGIQPSRIDVQALGQETPSDIDGGRDRVDAILH